MDSEFSVSSRLLDDIWYGLGGDTAQTASVHFSTAGAFASVFAVSDLAAASVAAAAKQVVPSTAIDSAHQPSFTAALSQVPPALQVPT